MPRDSSGNYSLPAGNPVVTGTTIASSWANTTFNDLSTEMTDSLSRSGKGGMLSQFKIADGAVGAPGLAFASEPGSGLYRSGAGAVSISVLGNQILTITTTGETEVTGTFACPTLSVSGNSTLTGTLSVGGVSVNAAAIITSGTFATARLGSGAASSATFLRGDQAWAGITSGNVSGLASSATTDTTNASNISSGTLANARLSNVGTMPGVTIQSDPGGTPTGTFGQIFFYY